MLPLIVCCLLGAHAVPARAHDLWLVPAETAKASGTVTIFANVGEEFPKSESAPDVAAFPQRLLIRPDGTAGILQAKGKKDLSGVLHFETRGPGTYVAAVETKPRLLTLAAQDFNHYLATDGLPHIYELRYKEKSLDQPGRERYSKYPKALVRLGGAGGGDPARVLGLLLEIVPLDDPFQLKVGNTLRVRVLFRGKPLPDANLGWQLPDEGDFPRGTVRTDGKGEALVPIARTGLMAIRLTHMTRPKAADYEWESFWTTLTFRIPD